MKSCWLHFKHAKNILKLWYVWSCSLVCCLVHHFRCNKVLYWRMVMCKYIVINWSFGCYKIVICFIIHEVATDIIVYIGFWMLLKNGSIFSLMGDTSLAIYYNFWFVRSGGVHFIINLDPRNIWSVVVGISTRCSWMHQSSCKCFCWRV